jgi:hypothetical protein
MPEGETVEMKGKAEARELLQWKLEESFCERANGGMLERRRRKSAND